MQNGPGDGSDRRISGEGEPAESGGVLVAARKTDGHTGVEYEVLSRLVIQPHGERLTVALARLREADWWRHYVLHIEAASEMGAILGALCGAGRFRGCPVVGDCRYVVLLSCAPGEQAPRDDVLREWFARLAGGLDEALRHWLRAMGAWAAGKVILGEAGLTVPSLSAVLESFSPLPREKLRLKCGWWIRRV